MIIKPSTALRNEYAQLSRLAKEFQEPIYITKNGEGDLVLMSLEAFEQREQLLQLRSRVLRAEEERVRGDKTVGIAEARKMLKERIDEI